jgi:hypothetical protein
MQTEAGWETSRLDTTYDPLNFLSLDQLKGFLIVSSGQFLVYIDLAQCSCVAGRDMERVHCNPEEECP